jgi:hypothetical protein
MMRGQPTSEKTRAAMRAAWTPEKREAARVAALKHAASPEWRARVSAATKAGMVHRSDLVVEIATLNAVWGAASAKARQQFLESIGIPAMLARPRETTPHG